MNRENTAECSEQLKNIKCRTCRYCLEVNGVKFAQHLHCKHYDKELKPIPVAFGDESCEFYEAE